jgi:hypothetical protein
MDKEIEKQKELQSAYESYQRASQNADADPDMFEQTRFRYYSLKNGEQWAKQERKQILDKKMGPVLDSYRQQFNDLDNQGTVQSAYTDSIATIRNKQSSLKDGVSGAIDYLGNLLSEKQDKIGAYNRYIQLTTPSSTSSPVVQSSNPVITYFSSFPPSFATVLDVFIAILILLLLVIVFRKSGVAFRNFGYPFTARPVAPAITSTPALTSTPTAR